MEVPEADINRFKCPKSRVVRRDYDEFTTRDREGCVIAIFGKSMVCGADFVDGIYSQ